MARDGEEDTIRALDPETLKSLHNVDQDLRLALPDFMIPSYYLPIHKFPLTASGKADGKQLQEWILKLAKEQQLAPYSLATRAEFQLPVTDMEVRLQKLWAEILGIEPESIGRDDSFLRLGGDSIAAIQLVSAARDHGIGITVASIFQDPRLSQVAASAEVHEIEDDGVISPFSLIPEDLRELMLADIPDKCGLAPNDEVEDMYPATVFQEGLMSLAVKKPGSYIAHIAFELPAEIDEGRFKAAWEETLRLCAILRTRIVTHEGHTIQAVIRQPAEWDAVGLQDIEMGPGTRLCRYAMVEGAEGKLFTTAIHHAAFDGWSLPLIMRTLVGAYEHGTAPGLAPYAGFVKYAMNIDVDEASQYWKSQLENATRPSFPQRPGTTSDLISTSQSLACHVPFDATGELPVTQATVLRAAWAILLAKYNDNTQDITFGATVAGRQAAVTDIENMAGPIIATIPVRIKLDSQQPVAHFLQSVQVQGAEMMPYEQMGIQNISKLGPGARDACDFSSLLVVQPHKVLDVGASSLLQLHSAGDDDAASSALAGYFTYPLVWQCYVTDSETALHVTFDSSVLGREQIETMVEQFCFIVQQLIAPDAHCQEDLTLAQISVSGPYDIALTRDWNNKIRTEIIPSTFHSLVKEQAHARPSAPAIFAWDGSLSYQELDTLSDRLANLLAREHGVVLEDLVLVCFEKSKWFYVAILAINKAGGAWVPLDPSHPRTRHEQVASQAGARLALASVEQADKCQGLVPHTLVVSADMDLSDPNEPPSIPVGPDNAAYVLFTSGTTGTPKGIVMEHGSLCTSQTAISRRLGLEAERVRLLQFAAYVFDLSIGEMIAPLISGGCLCVPSEQERMNDVVGFIDRARVNWAYLTPSFARMLRPDMVPSLELLILSGEPVGRDLLSTWAGRGLRLLNGWGPSETCCFSSLHEWSSPDQSPLNIGYPVGGRCWVVDPEDHHQLTPVGCVGEVVIQGPTIAREYLAYAEGTKANFITDLPSWAPQVDSHYARFYKSGDLAYYNPDGTMEFVARKDTQVKVRGFRIELGEVEHHIRNNLEGVRQVVVDALGLDDEADGTPNKLVAYLCFSEAATHPGSETGARDMFLSLEAKLKEKLRKLKSYLEIQLPDYMVPTMYVPVAHMPFITSQKTDRNRLRGAVSELSAQDFTQYMLGDAEKEAPEGEKEVALQKLWVEVLGIPEELVGRHDSFLQLGGDSLAAMRLVSKAREQGIELSVRSIFNDPRLSQVAKSAQFDFATQDSVPAPWTLVSEGQRPSIERAIQEQCSLPSLDMIQDAYPATALQEGLLALASKQPGSYMASYAFELAAEVDVDRFKNAWDKTLEGCHVLRTRIVLTDDQTIQAVIEHTSSWSGAGGKLPTMGYGTPLCTYSLDVRGNKRIFSLTMHHAIFDGWSFGIIMRTLSQAYEGQSGSAPQPAPYVSFVKYALSLDKARAAEYWREQVAGACQAEFPRPPSSKSTADSRASSSHTLVHHIPFNTETKGQHVTKATILRAAWAIVMARYNDTDDVTFGAAVAGRQASVAGIDDIVGPVLSTVPVRVRVQNQQHVTDFLLSIQAQAADMIPFEHMGLQNISRLGPDAREACSFSSMFSIMPGAIAAETQTKLLTPALASGGNTATDLSTYFTYPLVGQCFLADGEAILQLVFDSSSLSSSQVEGLAAQYSHVVQQLFLVLSGGSDTLLGDIGLCGGRDLAQIKAWHEEQPPINLVNKCVHDIISEMATQTPHKEAIYTSGESFTYAEVDTWSTRLCRHLSSLGVTRGTLVPICFEKSAMAIIAMVAIMKAGGAFVPLNPDHPSARQKRLVASLGATLILVTPKAADICEGLSIPMVTVTSAFLSSLDGDSSSQYVACEATPGDLAYVLFTSGSTGEPKGVMVEHKSLCSTISHRGDGATFTADSRVLQFSSYVFDISVCEIFATLTFGGTVCVPSDEERINDLAGFINKSQVTCAMLTPSFAKLLSPTEVPCLKTVLLVGEAPSLENIKTWSHSVELINDYGPAEACIYVTSHRLEETATSASTIGRGCTARLWIVEPNNHCRLAPVGCVGELLIEGPGVARGYLNDTTKTEQQFLLSAPWLTQSETTFKIYKTGDLVRYNQDGTVEYVGRKDSQTKINGQRMEPGEVEYHIKEHLGPQSACSVQIAQILGTGVLLAFVSTAGLTSLGDENAISPVDEETLRVFHGLNESIQASLPPYMVPSYYLPVAHLPLTASGKTNSKALRQWAQELSPEKLSEYSLTQQVEFQRPITSMEMALQQLWGDVLGASPESIGRGDSFLQLGGDSIAAIRLVAMARRQNITLTVSSIFRDPRLKVVAAAATARHEDGYDVDENTEPWSLLDSDTRVTTTDAARQQCSLSSNDVIEDIYPATPLQEGLMALATKKPGSYTARFAFELAPDVDISRFNTAWQCTLRKYDALRTRLVLCGEHTFQVVLQEPPEDQPDIKEMGYGSPLCQFSIVGRNNKSLFILAMHHAIFDRWSFGLILGTLTQAYQDAEAIIPPPAFANFVRYTLSLDSSHAADYWRKQLAEATRTNFPHRPSLQEGSSIPASRTMCHKIPLLVDGQLPVTKATILRAAWAIVLAQYDDNRDEVVFGAAVAGRQAPVANVESMVGPVFSTVPVRVLLRRQQSVTDFLLAVHAQANEMMAFEHFGIQNIAKLSTDAREACDFSSLLTVQHSAIASGAKTPLLVPASDADTRAEESLDLATYFTYPLVLQCSVWEDEATLDFVYDSSILSQALVARMANQFEHVVQQLLSVQHNTTSGHLNLGDVTLFTDQDMQEISHWHDAEPELRVVDSCVHDMIAEKALQIPEEEAIFSWDGRCTYAELDHMTAALASCLQGQGVGKESLIPICFEKSLLAVVAMIAVMRAGGAFVPLNPDHPLQRRQQLVAALKAPLVLSSQTTASTCQDLGTPILEVSTSSIMSLPQHPLLQDLSSPADTAYVLFTSGSTGEPKGVVIEHGAIASSILGHGVEMGLGPGSRMLQFSSYVFDAAITECLATLALGGCVCVPSDEQRLSGIEEFLCHAKVNTALLTPSFARTVNKDRVPTLQTLALGGEAPAREDVEKWQEKVKLLNAYGPTEAAVCISTHVIQSPDASPTTIGRGRNARLWVADLHDHNRLAPIGCIGELVIQGPTLSRGYLNDPSRTNNAFLRSPSWLPPGQYQRVYMTGDLVRYNSDGTIEHVGRKDSQVKLRGQRLELGEIEHRIKKSLGASWTSSVHIVDHAGTGDDALIAFVCRMGDVNTAAEDITMLTADEGILETLQNLDESLRAVMPAYMVPSHYLPINRLPLTTAGKTDGRALRNWVLHLSPDDLSRYSLSAQAKFEAPRTATERILQRLWGQVLGVPHEKISRNDSFLQLGGDSISAIRLVSEAREKHSISLTVASILQGARLSRVAASAHFQEAGQTDTVIEPFSLIPHDEQASIKRAAREQCALSAEEVVEDAYPATAFQEGLMALAVKQPGSYMAHFAFELADGVDKGRFRSAWESTVRACEALRTRIMLHEGRTFQVVVQSNSIEWTSSEVHSSRMEYATPLCSYSLSRNGDKTVFKLIMHHAVFDGWSIRLVLQRLAQAYEGTSLPSPLTPYVGFVQYSLDLDHNQATEYWHRQLDGASRPIFPRRAALSSLPAGSTSRTLTRSVPYDGAARTIVTKATLLRAAWAIVLARYNDGTDDITFGAAVAGRQAPVLGIERMVGPVVSTLPVRVKLDSRQRVGDFLLHMQSQATDMMPYEHMGLQHIAKLGPSAREACDFSSLLVIQPQAVAGEMKNAFLTPCNATEDGTSSGNGNQQSPMDEYFSYPLVWQCYLAGTEIHLHVTFDSAVLSESQVPLMAEQFCHVVKQLAATDVHADGSSTVLGDVALCGPNDTALVTQWNKEYEAEVISSTFHNLVEQQAKLRPHSTAIAAWDGEFTYEELDRLSTRWAYFLAREFCILPNELVMLCFEKSKWFYVAMLAANKAGGAWVPLDPSHPRHRHKQVIEQAKARIALVSSTTSDKCKDLVEHAVIFSTQTDEALAQTISEDTVATPMKDVQPNHAAYVLFTSGTTGTPKGMVMEHEALCTSMTSSSRRLKVAPDTVRVLQFAAYVFDMAIGEIVLPLISGACICVPSEHQRMNDLPKFINDSGANWAFLTPSFTHLLSPADIPDFELLLVGGEAVGKDLLTKWMGHVRLVNGYGPSEACCFASFNEYQTVDDSPSNVGHPSGARSWIVEPDDCHRLAPIGCVGELVLQGPTLAREYLAFEEGTKASFVKELPGWAPDKQNSRYSRFYKTGDLAYFRPDGSMEFITRKDTQVKVRGFRIELGEVESHIRGALGRVQQVAVDVLRSEGSGQAAARLVAYLCFSSATRTPDDSSNSDFSDMFLPMDELLTQEASQLKGLLEVRLPSYMVPVVYIPVRYMPFITSQKTDRNVLRCAANNISQSDLASYMLANTAKESLVTSMEAEMQSLWADILNIPLDQIGRNDSFLRLGGDSLAAIRLVAKARERGLELSVASVFRDARLSRVALATHRCADEDEALVQPWSLVEGEDRAAIEEAAEQQCRLSHGQSIEDIYPTTALQEGLMALAVKQPGSYTAKFNFELADADIDRFKAAWEYTLLKHAALRTRIFRYESRAMQAVIQGKPQWRSSTHGQSTMSYGSPLCQYTLNHEGKRMLFSLTMHHAIFDGWSLSLVMSTLAQAYESGSSDILEPSPSYSDFISYVLSLDRNRAAKYWREQLQDAMSPVFPPRQPPTAATSVSQSLTNGRVTQRVMLRDMGTLSITKATILRAAWAVVLAKYNGNARDITFGAAVAGRQAPVSGIENIVGPVISTVPVRVKLDPEQSVVELLESIQSQATEMMPFEQMGIQNISQLSDGAREACNFTSLFAVQHRGIFSGTQASFLVQPSDDDNGDRSQAADYNTYFTYPLVGSCHLVGDEAAIELVYDTSSISDGQATAIAAQYNHVVQQLLDAVQPENGEFQVGQVALCGEWDLEKIKHWHKKEPELTTVTSSIPEQVSAVAASSPGQEAIFAHDGQCTYAELEHMTNVLANHLRSKGVIGESLVPICFEKSMWTIVAMLAVMKAGGAFVPLSPDHPSSRRQQLLVALKAPLMLASPATLSFCKGAQVPLVVLSQSLITSLTTTNSDEGHAMSDCVNGSTPGSMAYVLFTSGSTGEPKGVMVEHQAIASSTLGYGTAMGLGPDSRVLQFSNYVFDGSIIECLATLVFGGCVCVPSEEQRLGLLGDFVNAAKVNWAILTPSFVRTLSPKEMPSLDTLVLGGEAPAKDVIDTWHGRVHLLNAYGPAEASVCIATHVFESPDTCSPRAIGHGRNARLWIVDADSEDRLAAVGCVGELVVQGPGLARGYLNDETRTRQAFIESPPWLPRSSYQRVYKTGDLVRYADEEGTIEYVGRKDTQVKLRGQRLEPGEIEHHIRELLPIAQQVSVIKTQLASQDTLVAFVCTQNRQAVSATFDIVPVDAGLLQTFVALAENLSARLPSYMVPAYFVPVTAMPTTLTGKLDARLLENAVASMAADVVQRYAAFQKAPFQEPRNETETELRRLFSNVLGIEEAEIGIDDSFHHLGGDSLKIMTLQNHIRRHFNKTLSFHFLSNGRSMSVRTLGSLVLGQASTDVDTTTNADYLGRVFANSLQQVWPPTNTKLRDSTPSTLPPAANVLLTGGTGYLGSALLQHLLVEQSIDKVAVLVRARDGAHALDRVRRSAQIAGWWDDQYLAKLDIWKGDLGLRGFGLAQDNWKALNGVLDDGNIDAIVHNGAAVDWSADFTALKSVNVDSTVQLIDIAFTSPSSPKLVYISGGAQMDQDDDRAAAARSLSSHVLGYSQTKVLSELVVCECAARLPALQNQLSTVKPGRIIGSAEKGIANTDDLIWRVVAAAARIRAYPQEPADHRMQVADVDFIAKRVLRQLSLESVGDEQEAAHAFAPYVAIDNGISIAEFWRVVAEVLADAKVRLVPVSWEEWLLKVQSELDSVGERHVLWPVQQFLGRLGSPTGKVNGHDGTDMTATGASLHLETALRKNVEYLVESGFLSVSDERSRDVARDVFSRSGL